MSVTHTDVTAAAAELEPCGLPEHPDCGIRDVLDRVGDKWSVLVVVDGFASCSEPSTASPSGC
jgi:DNA-binding HxlR family transcriptional regulator